MILALVGLFFYIFEKRAIIIPDKKFKKFFWCINIGILLSFFLSALFAHPPVVFNFLGGVGALLQLAALGMLLTLFGSSNEKIKGLFSSIE